MHKPLRLIYAGTPDFAVPALNALHAAGHEIIVVLTQPDRPAGRGQKLRASPVKQAAHELGIEVWQPLSLRKAEIKKQLRKLKADAMIVAAYGLILPQSVLDMPRLGCINIHASLLPRWRGAAPIHRAIEAGDEQTGITIMQMAAGLDTGDMLSVHAIDIESSDTSQSLHDKLSDLGASVIVETLANLDAGEIEPQVQDDNLATYANKLHKSEAEIDWSRSAQEIECMVRAFNPWPCAFTKLDDQPLKIWKASLIDKEIDLVNISGQVVHCDHDGIDVQTGAGVLRILELQQAGRKRMSVEQFVNANDLTNHVLG